jgi:hypothetical protein
MVEDKKKAERLEAGVTISRDKRSVSIPKSTGAFGRAKHLRFSLE